MRTDPTAKLEGVYRLVEAYEADVPARRSTRRVKANSSRLRALEDWMAPRGLLHAGEKDLRAWIKSCRLSVNTARSLGGVLFDFYHWAVTHQLVEVNPAEGLRRRPQLWQLVPADPDQRPGTLGETVKAYVWDRHGRGEITERSAAGLNSRLLMLVNVVGPDLPIGDLDRRAVLRFQHATGEHAAASRRAYLSTIRTFCGWAVAEGLLEANPTDGIAPIREPRRVPRALSSEDVARLLRTASENPRDLAMVWLLVGLGLRCVEVSRLELADYDDRARTVLVRGKAGHERLLPVPDTVAAALDAYLDTVGRFPGPLLRPAYGTGYDRDAHLSPASVSHYTTVLMQKSGIKQAWRDGKSAHALRHTAASDALDRCGNVRTVQAILGHASLASTEIYLRRANLDQMRDALEGRDYGTALGGTGR